MNIIFCILLSFFVKVVYGTGCTVQPSPDIREVQAGCTTDYGSCSLQECISCYSNERKCCGPVHKQKEVTCEGQTIEVTVVDKCTCSPCQEPTTVIAGTINNCDTTGSMCSNFAVEMNNIEVARADIEGKFQFETGTPQSSDRIVFSAVDDIHKFYRQVKVVNTVSETNVYFVTIDAIKKPNAIMFISTDGHTVPSIGTNQDVSVVFPANSFFMEDGVTPYTGNVHLALKFIDPTQTDSENSIPGELLTEGEQLPGFLSSFGMLLFDLTDDAGNPLTARQVEIYLRTNSLTLGQTQGLSLWSLNEDTGFWEQGPTMSVSSTDPTAKRRKKRGGNDFMAASIDVTDLTRIWNLDKLLISYCHMKVRLFVGQTQTENNQVSGADVTSLYARTGASGSPGWRNFLRRKSGNNGICVSVPCDATVLNSVKVAADGYCTVSTTISASDQTLLGYSDETTSFTITIPTGQNIVDNTNGPIYSDWSECYNAAFNEAYFGFGRELPVDEEINTIPFNEEKIKEQPAINDVLAWWPDMNSFHACYMAIYVASGKEYRKRRNTSPLDEEKVEIESFGGTHSVTAGKLYGKRTSYVNAVTFCVEYKCPSILYDGDYDRTELHVRPAFNGNYSYYTLMEINLAMFGTTEEATAANAQFGQSSFAGPAPTDFAVTDDGTYHSESTIHPLIAKADARNKCLSGAYGALAFISPVDSPN
uniref:cartilage intermediate layer protein 1-like n=1 Tax=Styela clava TaxID=7725 RepID=UPI001939383E|nr:cartilage intermediate layer protein 1-like [Styela clava]